MVPMAMAHVLRVIEMFQKFLLRIICKYILLFIYAVELYIVLINLSYERLYMKVI